MLLKLKITYNATNNLNVTNLNNINENLGTDETAKGTNRKCYRIGSKETLGKLGCRASNSIL